jgi:hypothetical protein
LFINIIELSPINPLIPLTRTVTSSCHHQAPCLAYPLARPIASAHRGFQRRPPNRQSRHHQHTLARRRSENENQTKKRSSGQIYHIKLNKNKKINKMIKNKGMISFKENKYIKMRTSIQPTSPPAEAER